MVNSLVERATSDVLIGPDWAVNIEICDMINHDPGQSKDIIKGVKKRLGSKNSKVQLLVLTLLETIIKNCGDVAHLHVAEKGVLHDMVKIVKKKAEFHVKEKILILIDTWQEAFGGSRARYPQYYAAYQELLRTGAVFPQRSERTAPVFTPPQTQPLASYPQNPHNSDNRQEEAESSAEPEYPTLSLTEIQNARGIMDVLAEMLNALDPQNKEGLKQEVIVDLVRQCRANKQRVVHLVNSTSDESLLSQGLALNDDLQHLLAKHESIASGTSVPSQKPNHVSARALVDVATPPVDNSKKLDGRSILGSGAGTQLANALLPTPPSTNGSATLARVDPKMDLLSGDDYNSPRADNSLALVPVGESQPKNPMSQENALILFDVLSESNSTSNSSSTQPSNLAVQANPFSQFQQQPNLQSPQPAYYPNGSAPQQQNLQSQNLQTNGSGPNMPLPQHDQSIYVKSTNPVWNGQQQQQPPSPRYGAQSSRALPLPPWEAQAPDNSQQSGTLVAQSQPLPTLQAHPMGNPGAYTHPIAPSHLSASNQFVGLPPQTVNGGQFMGMLPQPTQTAHVVPTYPQQLYGNQLAGYGYGYGYGNSYGYGYGNGNGYGYGYGYGYGQQQDAQFIDQRMYGLSVRDDSASRNSLQRQVSPSGYALPPSKPSKPEDKLFGDLVIMAKVKSAKPSTGTAGSM